MLKYKTTQVGAITTMRSDNGFNLFITSDIHFDSVYCNRDRFFKDLEIGIDRGCNIIIVGDLFDAMNGRFDPRRDMSHLRPEYRRDDYYDFIVDDAVEKLKPYAKHILMITEGNHEGSVLKNANTDLIGRLTKKLNILRGGYGGIILAKDKKHTTPIKYFHGSGGEAPVTKGAIQTNRQAVFLPDFQIVLNGHSHNAYWIPLVRERVSFEGEHYYDIQHHIRTPGYLMSYGDGTNGWEVTRGGVPKPVGSFVLKIKDGEIFPYPIIHAPKAISPVIDQYSGIVFPQDSEEGVKHGHKKEKSRK
jgi:hypothetical protein